MSHKPARERRRHKRYSVFINGLVQIRGNDPVPCTIRDFSDDGMLLTVGSEVDAGSIGVDDRLRIVLQEPGGRPTVQPAIDVRVVRAASAGFGVRPVGQSADGLARRLRSRIGSTTAATLRDTRVLDQALAPDRLLSVCKKSLDAMLAQVMIRFFEIAGERLKEAAQQASNDSMRNACDEACHHLNEARDRIRTRFSKTVHDGLDACFTPESQAGAIRSEPEPDTLSLVDPDEFDDWLNLSSVVVRIEAAHEAVLSGLEQRLSAVMNKEINHASNPLAPASLCDALRRTIDSVPFSNGVRNAVYRSFEDALTSSLASFYRQIDQILPDAPAAIDAASARPEAPPEPDRPDGKPGSGQAPDPAPQSHPAATRTHLFDTVATLITPTDTASGRAAPAAPADRPDTASAPLPAVLAALTDLHNHPNDRSAPNLNAGAIKNRLQQRLSTTGPQGAALGPDVERAIDVGDRLFDAVLEQTRFFPAVAPHIERLHLPFLRLTLMDPEFIESERHPAHRLFELLDQAAAAPMHDGDIADRRLRDILAAIGDQLAAIAPEDVATIEQITDELARLVEPLVKARALNTERVIQTCEGRLALENARCRVSELLKRRLAGKSVPTVIVSLLAAGWEHLLLLEALPKSTELQNRPSAIELLDTLLRWLNDRTALAQTDLSERQQTLDHVENLLEPVCTDRFRYTQVVDELRRTVTADETDGAERAVAMTTVLPNAYDRPSTAVSPPSPEIARFIRRVRQLQLGDWLLFHLDKTHRMPLKLVWVDPQRSQNVFVDRRGQKQLQLSCPQLAQRFRDRTVSPTENLDLPLFERCATAMFRQMHGALFHEATHDPVTGLINHRTCLKRLQQVLARPLDGSHVFCYLRIDHFRMISDRCGPDAIDRLSRQIAAILEACVDREDIVARLRDDTFGILFTSGAEAGAVERLSRLHREMDGFHFQWQNHALPISVSAGLLPLLNEQIDSANRIVELSGEACAQARRLGRNNTHVYRADQDHRFTRHAVFELAGRIDQLISADHLQLQCQKIAAVETTAALLPHYEILLRIRDDNQSPVSPERFLTAAEQLKHMVEVDRWVITTTLAWVERHRDQLDAIDGFSINLSGQSLNSDRFLDALFDQLTTSKTPLAKLTFEITESVAIANLARMQKFIESTKRLGCRFSLDDFGTGFSSYAYLKNLGVDYLKIDGTFVKTIDRSSTDFAVVRSINQIGHYLGLKTIAEYVESQAINTILARIGVDFAQGYAIGKPLPLDQLDTSETQSLPARLNGTAA